MSSAAPGRRVCRWVTIAFALAWAAALAILLIATFGLFGEPRDPLGGIFLLPLGLPWNLLIDLAPERTWPLLGAMAPGLNLLLIAGVCRRLGLPSN